jgi:beta-barrel assembly-enhancing protease
MGSVANVIVNNADMLMNMKYGRGLEKEADLDGLQLLSERKIDCNGFVRLFELLKGEQALEVGEWISSHPKLDRRIAYVKEDELFNKKGVEQHPRLDSIFRALKAMP